MKRTGRVQEGLSPVRGSSSLIPGLPDEVALIILVRLPQALHGSLRCVCRAWRDALQPSLAMTALRNSLHISEMWILFLYEDTSIALYDPLLQHLSSPIPFFWDIHCLLEVGGAVGSQVYFLHEYLHEDFDEEHIGDIRCFDTASMQWQVDSIPLWDKVSIYGLAGAVVDDHLWLVGAGADARAAWRFDVKSRRWEKMPKMHEGHIQAAAVVLHGRLHVLGGYRELGRNKVHSGEIWDPIMGEWIHQPELWPSQLSFRPPMVAVVMDTLYALKGESIFEDVELVQYVSESKLWASLGHLPLEEYPCSCGEGRFPRLVGAGRELWVVLNCREMETTCTIKILSWVPATGSSPILWRSVHNNLSLKFPPGFVRAYGKVFIPELQAVECQNQIRRLQSLMQILSTPISRRMDILIDLWFHKFILYEMKWMFIYLKGSQPWHYAIKWFTCNHFLMRGKAHERKIICNKPSLLFKIQGKVVSFLIVCSIYWIKFQPLWFAIKKISIGQIDEAFDFDQGILWIRVLNY